MADTFVSVTWVADELVTSTKLNQAMANQANFHNGTALGDGIIVTRHLAAGAVNTAALGDAQITPSKLDAPTLGSVWQTLADVSVTGSAATNLTTPNFTPMRFMEIEINGVVAAIGGMISLQFNNDSGVSNYSRYTLVNGTAQSADTSGVLIGTPASAGAEFNAFFKLFYRSSSVQPNGEYMSWIVGGDQRMGAFLWKNASNAITTARLNCLTTGGIGVGTRIVIKGHN